MDDRVHRSLAVSTLVIALVASAGWRALGDPVPGGRGARAVTAAKPVLLVPNPGLDQLIPYAAPLSDSVAEVAVEAPAISVRRDPFADAPEPAPVRESPRPDAKSAEGQHETRGLELSVTATLVAGARRAAVINDSLIYVGGVVPGAGRLTAVESDHVVVTDAKGTAHTVAVKERG